jgi:hypothetical protein
METLAPERTVTGTTGETVQSVLSQAVNSSERVEVFASAERRVGENDFEQVAVILTNERLLIVSPSRDLGFELSTATARSSCGVSQTDEADDSMSVVVDASGTYFALHFPASWRPEAETLVDTLAGREDAREVDRYALFAELSGLVDLAADTEALG